MKQYLVKMEGISLLSMLFMVETKEMSAIKKYPGLSGALHSLLREWQGGFVTTSKHANSPLHLIS